MTIVERLHNIDKLIFCFGKSDEYQYAFCKDVRACSMYETGYGLGIPGTLSPENQLYGVFTSISDQDGVFAFNISAVNLHKAINGFESYDFAASINMITEWELSVIFRNLDYLNRTIFHNGKVEFIQNPNGIELKWN